MYFVIIFLSPLYFALRGKWGAFLLNSLLYALAVLTMLFGVGVVFWALAVGHAGWHLKLEHMEKQAELIAKKSVVKPVTAADLTT